MKPTNLIEAKAVGKYLRISPNKVRRVLDQIRGRNYKETVMMLEFMPYRCCTPILKLVKSAAANAEHNKGMSKKDLSNTECLLTQIIKVKSQLNTMSVLFK